MMADVRLLVDKGGDDGVTMVLKWVGGDEGGGMMMVAVDLWWGRGLGRRGWSDGVAGKVGRKKVAAPEVSPEIERRRESSVCED
ncbi:hypothetical protein Tco_1085181 [Tanacetum coccineum]